MNFMHRIVNPTAGNLVKSAGLGAVIAVLLCCGCASLRTPRPEPITVPQIVEMCKAGVPADDIIQKLKASGTVYRLQASQLAELKADGVPDAVINYMQQTYLDAAARDAAFQEWSHRNRFDNDGYGGMPYGWPHDRIYIIREQTQPLPSGSGKH
jgi:hypothetical protein